MSATTLAVKVQEVCDDATQVPDGNYGCKCDPAKHYTDVEGACTCDATTSYVTTGLDPVCQQCPSAGLAANFDTTVTPTCTCTDPNASYSSETNECTCDGTGNYVVNSAGNACVCDANNDYVVNSAGDACQQCPTTGLTAEEDGEGACTCADSNASWDRTSNACSCDASSNYVVNSAGDACQQCPTTGLKAEENGGTCDCDDSHASYNIVTNTCTCDATYVSVNNVCCKPGEACSGCSVPTYVAKGTDVCCGVNEKLSSGTCVCKTGYVKVGGVCKLNTCGDRDKTVYGPCTGNGNCCSDECRCPSDYPYWKNSKCRATDSSSGTASPDNNGSKFCKVDGVVVIPDA